MKITEFQATNIQKYNTDKFGKSDKFTVHAYGDFYNELFKDKRNDSLIVGEIGIYNGGSVRLWHDYLNQSQIVGVDIYNYWDDISQSEYPRLQKYYFNAYDIKSWDVVKDVEFDILIEDGSHNFTDQLYSMNNLYKLTKKGSGLLVIEDVPINYLDRLLTDTTVNKDNISVYNWYDITKRFDDIIIVIKNK